MANDERDDNIKNSTNYIIIFNVPVWIQIKKYNSCTDRAKNVHFMLKRLEKIEDNERHWSSQSENVLLSALYDNEKKTKSY